MTCLQRNWTDHDPLLDIYGIWQVKSQLNIWMVFTRTRAQVKNLFNQLKLKLLEKKNGNKRWSISVVLEGGAFFKCVRGIVPQPHLYHRLVQFKQILFFLLDKYIHPYSQPAWGPTPMKSVFFVFLTCSCSSFEDIFRII